VCISAHWGPGAQKDQGFTLLIQTGILAAARVLRQLKTSGDHAPATIECVHGVGAASFLSCRAIAFANTCSTVSLGACRAAKVPPALVYSLSAARSQQSPRQPAKLVHQHRCTHRTRHGAEPAVWARTISTLRSGPKTGPPILPPARCHRVAGVRSAGGGGQEHERALERCANLCRLLEVLVHPQPVQHRVTAPTYTGGCLGRLWTPLSKWEPASVYAITSMSMPRVRSTAGTRAAGPFGWRASACPHTFRHPPYLLRAQLEIEPLARALRRHLSAGHTMARLAPTCSEVTISGNPRFAASSHPSRVVYGATRQRETSNLRAAAPT
jgi:hypothetical protein